MKRLVIRPIVLTVLAVSLAGCQVTARDDSPITSGAAPLSVVLDLPSASQEIAVDSATNTLWVASVQTAGKDTLWSVDMTKGTSRAYDLPDVDYSGYTVRRVHVRGEIKWVRTERCGSPCRTNWRDGIRLQAQ